jgi:hypothetical protein
MSSPASFVCVDNNQIDFLDQICEISFFKFCRDEVRFVFFLIPLEGRR